MLDDLSHTVCPLIYEAWGRILDGYKDRIELTLIGGTEATSNLGHDWVSAKTSLLIPDAQIHIVPFDLREEYTLDDLWYESENGIIYRESHGTDILVASAALAILSLATSGRMTHQRVWRMAMLEGRSIEEAHWRSFARVDYFGPILEPRREFPKTTPGFPDDTFDSEDSTFMKALEGLGDSDVIQHKIIWDGRFWTWMQPDLFPLDGSSSHHATTPSLLEPQTSLQTLSTIEQLPFEIVVEIASHCPLPSVLCLFSVSRHLRSNYLGSRSDRDHLARAWIKISAPWYDVHLPNKDHVYRSCGRDVRMDWAYLTRCVASGSMMNRKRIWGVAEQLELKAKEMGI